MKTENREDLDRWTGVVCDAYQVSDYPWPTDADQFNAAISMLRNVCANFPEEDFERDLPGSAVQCFAAAVLAAMRLVPPEALDGAVIRPHRADQAAGDEPPAP